MKSSHTSPIFILMLSLFALDQCVRMEAREIERWNKIYIPTCFHVNCDPTFSLKRDCYCCGTAIDQCYDDQQYCNAHCPPPKV
ncbi:hypothetical protein ARALYDRAFT_888364 [Arabidopsis lyrata subsp. lyrata]|uniref:Embryo surrounding factor 1 brassicaceae domain-containing protein n=1 Tax=Arabidopsis lyrata subsp. lyrata TaxID=81972 RepID=D7KLI7_ARALL|nr:hypothetical protein ARALYDRAFT_888364 [Arabidopsis lyrata subsp. lyrata]